MSSGLPIYAKTAAGQKFAGVLTHDGTYKQMSNGSHFFRQQNSKGMDVAIYETLLRNGCKLWKVTDKSNSAPPLVMPFSKIALLLKAGAAKKVKYPGFEEQIQIPLEHFNMSRFEYQEQML